MAQARPAPEEQDEPGVPAGGQQKGTEAEVEEENPEDVEEDEEDGEDEGEPSASQPTAEAKPKKGRNVAWLIVSAAAGGVAIGTFVGGVTRTGTAWDASERHDRGAFEQAQTNQYALYAVAGTMAAVSAASLLIYFFAGDKPPDREDEGDEALLVGPGPGQAGLSMEWRF